MSTRSIGRGKCPKCGEEGTVVLKEISGGVYVYVKHGRRWCYLGPLASVNLASILVSLKDYHSFTTKFAELLRHLGDASLGAWTRLGLAVAASSLVAAYCLAPYPAVAQALAAISAVSAVLAVAAHEARGGGYGWLASLAYRRPAVHIAVGAAAVALSALAGLGVPSTARFSISVTYPCPAPPPTAAGHGACTQILQLSSVTMPFNLPSIVLAGTAVALTVRPLAARPRRASAYAVAAAALGFTCLAAVPAALIAPASPTAAAELLLLTASLAAPALAVALGLSLLAHLFKHAGQTRIGTPPAARRGLRRALP